MIGRTYLRWNSFSHFRRGPLLRPINFLPKRTLIPVNIHGETEQRSFFVTFAYLSATALITYILANGGKQLFHNVIESHYVTTPEEFDPEVRKLLHLIYLQENFLQSSPLDIIDNLKKALLILIRKQGLSVRHPFVFQIYLKLAHLYEGCGLAEEAIDVYLRLSVALNETDIPCTQEEKQIHLFRITKSLGHLYLSLREVEIAEPYLVRSLKLISSLPNSLVLPIEYIQCHLDLGNLFSMKRAFDFALPLLHQCLRKIEQFKQSSTDSSFKIELDCYSAIVLNSTGEIMYSLDQTHQATSLFLKALKICQNHAQHTLCQQCQNIVDDNLENMNSSD